MVAAYLRMMGMDPNPRKCAMATTEGVPGLQLCPCPHLEHLWHWVPPADSVPYLGLQLQLDGEFSLQRKHWLRLAAMHHWCLNTLAPPKVVQDVILAIIGRVTQYVAPFIADDSDTATWTTSRCRSRSTGHGTLSTPRGTARRTTGPWGLRGCERGASGRQLPSWAPSTTTAWPPCVPRSPGCSGKL